MVLATCIIEYTFVAVGLELELSRAIEQPAAVGAHSQAELMWCSCPHSHTVASEPHGILPFDRQILRIPIM